MLFRKTRDIIIETATLVRGVKDSQDEMQKDFKDHIVDEDKKINGLYNAIKDCHDSCSESDKFDAYMKAQNGTLLRIEKKYDNYHDAVRSMKKGMESVSDEVKSIKNAKKTIRQMLLDTGKIIGYICIVAGLIFTIMKFADTKHTIEDKKIEQQLEKIVDKLINN